MSLSKSNITTTNPTTTTVISEEIKEHFQNNGIASKFDHELFKDEDNIALPVVRVRHFSLPNKRNRWKIFENNKPMLIIEGTKLNKRERVFLGTIEGVSFVIAQWKVGVKSFNTLKKSLQIRLPKPPKMPKSSKNKF